MLNVEKNSAVSGSILSSGGNVGSVYVRDGCLKAFGRKWSPQVPSHRMSQADVLPQ